MCVLIRAAAIWGFSLFAVLFSVSLEESHGALRVVHERENSYQR